MDRFGEQLGDSCICELAVAPGPAAVIDKHFFKSLGHMEGVGDLSSGDIAWFTVDFIEEEGGGRFRLARDNVHVTTLERATEGLTVVSPVTLPEFEEGIRAKLAR